MALVKNSLGQSKDVEGKVTTHVDILLHGRSGAGKTFAASTMPQPMYVIACDPTGHKSIPYTTEGKVINQVKEAFDIVEELHNGGHGYKTVLLDGFSFLNDMFVKEMGWYFHESMGAKDPDLMPIQGRMKILNRTRALLRDFIDLSQVENESDRVHVIITTLEERLKESEEAPFNIRPLFGTESMNIKFPAMMSCIGYVSPRGGQTDEKKIDKTRITLFTEMNGIMARDRLGIFPDYVENINFSDYIS